MKKLIKILFISFLVLFLVATIGLIIFIKTFNFNSLKPHIVSACQDNLGRSIDFGNIAAKISLANGIQLGLTDLAMGEHPDFGDKDFLTAEQVNLGVSLKDLILKRQVRIFNIEAVAPEINIIRLKDGRINVQSFSSVQKEQSSSGQASMAIPAILINRLNIEDAHIQYIDYSMEPKLVLDLQKIQLNIKDLSLTEPFSIEASAALFSDDPNIFFESKGEVNLADLAFALKDGKVNIDIKSLSIEELRQSLPQLQKIPLFDVSSGKLESAIKLIEVGKNGLKVNLDADLKDLNISLPEVSQGVSLELQRINAKVRDFSLNDEFTFNIEAAYLSQSPNIEAQGKALIDLDNQACEIQDLEVNTDLSKLSLLKLSRSIPQLKNVPLPKELEGKLKVTMNKLIVASSGLSELKAQINLSNGLVRLKELAVPIDNILAQCLLDESNIILENVSLSLGKGTVQLSGRINDYLGSQQFGFKAKAEDIDISECLNQGAYPVKAEGLIFADFQINGQGFNPDILKSNLAGSSKIEIQEGKLVDINILKMVLDKLSFVPNLARTLENNLPERFKEKLKNKDTIVTAATIDALIRNGSILIQPINLEADSFIFNGNGSIGMDQSYGLEGAFVIPQDLTEKIIEAVPEMKVLLDNSEQIKFPLKVSGQGAAVSFYPDIASIGTAVIKNKAQEELGKVLNKIFDKNDEQAPQEGAEQQPQENSQQSETAPSGTTPSQTEGEEKDSTKQLIESITNIIFGQ